MYGHRYCLYMHWSLEPVVKFHTHAFKMETNALGQTACGPRSLVYWLVLHMTRIDVILPKLCKIVAILSEWTVVKTELESWSVPPKLNFG